jgi:FkbM family methyltransferase
MEHDYLKHYKLCQNDTVLDLGSTEGDFLKENIKEIKEKKIHVICVEPEPKNISVLAKYIYENALENATIISGMAARSVGKDYLSIADFYLLHHNTRIEKQKWEYNLVGNYLSPTYDLNYFCRTFGTINFLKCDIEGAEIDVFCYQLMCVHEHIKNIAIACYHVIDGKRTHETLIPFLKLVGYNIITDLHPEADNKDMIYGWRK